MHPEPGTPLRHDGVTLPCPVCGTTFVPTGRKRYCGDACKAKAYRRRHGPTVASVVVPVGTPRRSITVYECFYCGARALGEQRCDCGRFMARLGYGGCCPTCDEPVALSDLLDEGVMPLA